ncbi:MAG: tetratricopeptide repeat protein [Sphingobacteriia bacterium]|nr:tetratricopeptide repeat protein [Sphingobacteriia bacterium]NCC40046.1 tetratricopeptide repeat protein [Gammaproteobacteria bacterium]
MSQTQSGSAARIDPAAITQQLRHGIELFRRGHGAAAADLMRALLKHAPDQPDALHVLGLLAARDGRLEEAERLLRRCVKVAPEFADGHNNLGNVLLAMRQPRLALAAYRRAARLAPDSPLPHYNLGNVLRELGQLEEAETSYREAMRLAPDNPDIQTNLVNLLLERGAEEAAQTMAIELIERHPQRPELRLNLGNILRRRGRLDQARAAYEGLLAARPGHPQALLSLALVALAEHDLSAAEHWIELAESGAAAPEQERLTARFALSMARGDQAGALAVARAAFESAGESPSLVAVAAELLAEVGEHRQALELLKRGRARFGERLTGVLGAEFHHRRALCDWRDWGSRAAALVTRIRAGDPAGVSPFSACALPGLEPADLLRVARERSARVRAALDPLTANPRRAAGERIRLGYLSADFRAHATAYLTAALFEHHDRAQFELFAYSLGADDGSPIRDRLRAAFEHFVDLSDQTHQAAARRIHDDGIDILVDLNGHTRGARLEILASRPAPVQVDWLGFPGSTGASFMDYLIVDPVVVPPADAMDYSEALAYLPTTYQPVDDRRSLAPPTTRAREGLPDAGLVLCCFNNPYKITPEVFALWCDLLRELPEAVLWLYAKDPDTRANLVREAGARGVPARRLVFAEQRPQAEHLARLALADLFLDTRPYNAHTTASDALWAGVPVLTCPGRTFPSRVAASLLRAVGLPELIATDLDDYRARALRLARAPEERAELQQRLRAARDTAPLFDVAAFARALESLYRQMWRRDQDGLPPTRLMAD